MKTTTEEQQQPNLEDDNKNKNTKEDSKHFESSKLGTKDQYVYYY